MKELPGPWTPVAVFHSNNTSCCMFGTMVSCWRWGWVFSKDLATVGPGTAFWCSAFSVPRVTSTLMADWTWSWVFVGLERVTHNWKSPAVAQRCSAVVYTSPPPFSFAVLKGLKEEGHGIVMLWGRILLLTWKLHFFFSKSFAFWCSFSVQPYREWAGPGSLGPLTQLHWGTWLCSCESGKPCCLQVWSEADLGLIISKCPVRSV